MLIALVLFNVVHPGKIMAGVESDFPTRKERKNMAPQTGSNNDMMVLPMTEPAAVTSQPSKSEKKKSKSLWRVL